MSDWPCKQSALDSARQFVRDAASKGGKVVLAPDRDADGLCAGKPGLLFFNIWLHYIALSGQLLMQAAVSFALS